MSKNTQNISPPPPAKKKNVIKSNKIKRLIVKKKYIPNLGVDRNNLPSP